MGTIDSFERQEIIQVMRRVESGYSDWSDAEINNQIDAIYQCGYEWIKDKGFRHKVGDVNLFVRGLHIYSPERIHTTYKNVWSKDFYRIKARLYSKKTFKSLFYSIPAIIVSFFFRIEVTYLVIIISLPFFTYYYYKYSFYLKKHKRQNPLD